MRRPVRALELGTVFLDGEVDSSARVRISLAMLNRHGLVAGATGTGRPRPCRTSPSSCPRPACRSVMADIKGDLSGPVPRGAEQRPTKARATETGDDWAPTAFPVEFLSLGADSGAIPIRATLTSSGPSC